jgi:hypothetical protein
VTRPPDPRPGPEFLGEWLIVAGIFAAAVGIVAELVASRAPTVWGFFTAPQVVAPADDFGILRVGVGVGLALLGALIRAVRWVARVRRW